MGVISSRAESVVNLASSKRLVFREKHDLLMKLKGHISHTVEAYADGSLRQVLIGRSVDGKWYPTLRLGIRRLMVVPACLRDADISALDVVMPVELEIEPGRSIVLPP